MVIVLQNTPTPADTYTVRAGKIVQIPRFGEVSLEGVLRSELTETVSKHLARFLRDPTVRATPLVRLGVLGRVNRPGYYYPAADVILSDVLMTAGGPAPDADLNKVVIRRGPDVIWNNTDTRTALADGLTLDRLHLRAGDEIDIGQKKQFSWTSVVPIVSGIVLVIASLARLR
jgi:protein involved in polysaccharide export with SLBB domain